MDNKIVSLHGEAPADAGIVHDDVVKELEWLLDKAKRGDIVAFGYYGVKPNRHIFHGWLGCSRGYTFELMAGVASCQYRLLRANIEPDDDATAEEDI